MLTMYLFAAIAAGPVDPQPAVPFQLCESAAKGLRDMRWDRGGTRPEYVDARLKRCANLVSTALEEGLNVEGAARVVAIAYNETNFRPWALGQHGEQGMLQVQPKWHCHRATKENGECDHDRAGIRLLRALKEQEQSAAKKERRRFSWANVLWRYNGSSYYGAKVDRYARAALRHFRRDHEELAQR